MLSLIGYDAPGNVKLMLLVIVGDGAVTVGRWWWRVLERLSVRRGAGAFWNEFFENCPPAVHILLTKSMSCFHLSFGAKNVAMWPQLRFNSGRRIILIIWVKNSVKLTLQVVAASNFLWKRPAALQYMSLWLFHTMYCWSSYSQSIDTNQQYCRLNQGLKADACTEGHRRWNPWPWAWHIH